VGSLISSAKDCEDIKETPNKRKLKKQIILFIIIR